MFYGILLLCKDTNKYKSIVLNEVKKIPCWKKACYREMFEKKRYVSLFLITNLQRYTEITIQIFKINTANK